MKSLVAPPLVCFCNALSFRSVGKAQKIHNCIRMYRTICVQNTVYLASTILIFQIIKRSFLYVKDALFLYKYFKYILSTLLRKLGLAMLAGPLPAGTRTRVALGLHAGNLAFIIGSFHVGRGLLASSHPTVLAPL